MGHKLAKCPNTPNKDKNGCSQGQIILDGQGKQRVPHGYVHCNNKFYAFHARQQEEETPDIVIIMLKAFNFDM